MPRLARSWWVSTRRADFVARLRAGFSESPGAMALSASGDLDLTREVSAMLAREMRALGLNWNFAPVVDITHDISNPSVGTRSLGGDKDRVSRFAQAEIEGFQSESVAACAKHFPGLGNTPVDTHEALAVIDSDLAFLWDQDLRPFRASVDAGVASMMVSHVLFKQLDPDYPATLSPAIITGLLRGEIGFTGVAATDCMEMKAVADHYGPGKSAVLAVMAGIDLVLFSHTRAMQEAAYEAVLTAAKSGRIPESRLDNSLARITTMKQRYATPDRPPLHETIRCQAHLDLAQRAATSGVLAYKTGGSLVPLPADRPLVCVEFGTRLDSGVIDSDAPTQFARLLHARLPNLVTQVLDPATISEAELAQALEMAQDAQLILATRNAHLYPAQAQAARQLIEAAADSVLVCLRNPYDASILSEADAVYCTHGDSSPSLQAAAAALCGDFVPTAQAVVPL